MSIKTLQLRQFSFDVNTKSDAQCD